MFNKLKPARNINQVPGGALESRKENPEAARLARQTRKLEDFYLSGGNINRFFENRDVPISDAQEKSVHEMLRRGQVSVNQEESLLRRIKGPLDDYGSAGVFAGIQDREGRLVREGVVDNNQEKHILAYMTGLPWNEFNSVTADSLEDFTRQFQTPMDFEEESNKFLEKIRAVNTEKKYEEYARSMESFKRKVYGKKQEYWEAMKGLHEAALRPEVSYGPTEAIETWAAEREQSVEKEPSYFKALGNKVLRIFKKHERVERPEENREPGRPRAERERQASPETAFKKLRGKESLKILESASLEGDPIGLTRAEARNITKDELLAHDLAPKFELSLEDVKYETSRAFKIGSRDALIAYVKTPDGKVSARSYYRSNSQGVWRYLPDYAMEEGRISWYGKGADEQQLTLPMEIQGRLNRVAEESYKGKTEQEKWADPETYELFFGTAKKIRNRSRYHADRSVGSMNDALSREVSALPNFKLDQSLDFLPPESLDVAERFRPDFSKKVGEFKISSATYGENATASTYATEDGRMRWTFVEDAKGRACIAGAEIASPITSTGLRKNWVRPGDLATPLYEYKSQDHGLGDYNDQSGSYVNMWQNCCSRMPMIRRYKASKTTRR